MVSLATALADMVAAQQTVAPGVGGSPQDLSKRAEYAMLPLPASSLSMSVSSYTYPAGTAVVKQDWQRANPCPTTLSAPKSTQDTASATTLLVNRGDGVIAVQASYTYLSLVSSILPTTTFTRTVYARPRFWAVLCPTC